MARYAGKKGLVYISASGSTVATAVINLNAWSLDRSTDKIDVTAFGDANKVYVQGLPDISGSFGGWFDDTTIDALFVSAASTDGVKMYLYESSDAITKYEYGPAWLDLSIATGVGDAVSVSGSFVAAGAWGHK